MKNTMNPPILRKLYIVSLLAYQMQQPKKFKEFSLEFLILFGFDVFAI